MPGSESLYEQVRAAARQVPNVRFHGPIPYQEVGEFYERARVFVGTSEIEGFPNTYLQAAFTLQRRLDTRYWVNRYLVDLVKMF